MNRKTLILGAAALLACTTVSAQQAPNAPQRQRAQMDANADGSVSRAEAQAAAEARWTRMDANRDGRLDRSDREQARTQRRAEMFQHMDVDGNGSVSRAEWDQAADARAARQSADNGGAGRGRGEGRRARIARRGGGSGSGHHGGPGMIARLDSNRDQVITREEFMAAVTERHAAMDTNGDGNVTAAEREAQRAEHRGRQGNRAE